MGHSDIFDINVPGFFFKIWYQCPNSCPTFLTQILSLYDMKLRITITWIVEFFSYCVYFMWKQYWFHQIHTTKLGLGEAVWEKCFVSHLAQNFDIKCPSWWPQILISSHCSCPTLTVLSVCLICMIRTLHLTWKKSQPCSSIIMTSPVENTESPFFHTSLKIFFLVASSLLTYGYFRKGYDFV